MKTTTPAPEGATLPNNVARLLRDPEAVAAIERLRFLGYTPDQVGLAMEATKPADSGWVFPNRFSRKAHFIDDGRSLCGAWLYLGNDWLVRAPVGDRCKKCDRRLS